MNKYNTKAFELKREITGFAKRVCDSKKKSEQKLVANMLYGMSESGSCRLTDIARGLNEDILLKKTVERLSNGLEKFKLDETINKNYLKYVKKAVKGRAILVIDDSDVVKPCSKAMEGLARVRDGSTGEVADGYWAMEACALSSGNKLPIPIYTRLYSTVEKSFISVDDEALKCFAHLTRYFGKGCIRTMDRGFDNVRYYKYFLTHNEEFVIRAKINRDVIFRGEKLNILKLSQRYKGKYLLKFAGRNKRTVDCKISMIPVRLPKLGKSEFNLVIVYGFSHKEPILLLTNTSIEDEMLPVALTKVYLTRWRIEEFFKFKKQQFEYEDFRVRSLNRIRALTAILSMLAGLIAFLCEKHNENKLVDELIEISKRVKKYDKSKRHHLKFYALADGIARVLKKTVTGIKHYLSIKTPPERQFSLFSKAFGWAV